jgi:hypothetical protein
MEKHYQPFLQATRSLTQAEFDQKLHGLEKPSRETYEKAKAVLNAQQAARLLQVTIWAHGPLAFSEPDVSRELNLTIEQKGALKTIGDEYMNERASLAKPLQRRPGVRLTKEEQARQAEESTKVAALQDDLRAGKQSECLDVLTDEQKARFEKLKGPKFELNPRSARAP